MSPSNISPLKQIKKYFNITPKDVFAPWEEHSDSFEIARYMDSISKFLVILDRSEVMRFLISESFKLEGYEDIITKYN